MGKRMLALIKTLGLAVTAVGGFLLVRRLLEPKEEIAVPDTTSKPPNASSPAVSTSPPKKEEGLFSSLASDMKEGLSDKPKPKESQDYTYGVFRTQVGLAGPHPNGGFRNWKGMTLTFLPLVDTLTGLYARMSYDDAVKQGQLLGARLLTWDEFALIAREGFIIEPCTLVFSAEDQKKMRSKSYCEKHDACVAKRLAESGYDGSKPVSNVGKQWLYDSGGMNHGWWVRRKAGKDSKGNPAIVKAWDSSIPNDRSNLVPIQDKGAAHVAEHVHYTDYSQLVMLRKL